MAVIGSRDNFNRDPRKMGAFYAGYYSGTRIPYNGSSDHALNTTFFNSMTATVTPTAYVANQYETIYTVSGKGGSLIHAISCHQDLSNQTQAITFEVTVDGVVYEIPLGTSLNGGYVRGYLGSVGGTTLETGDYDASSTRAAMFSPTTMASTSNSNPNQNINNTTLDYAGPGTAQKGSIFIQNLAAANHAPNTCCRFENSLTVKVKTDRAIASSLPANARTSGVLCKLDF